MEGFLQQLTWWIIVDDQVINQCFKSVCNADSFAISLLMSESKELHELLLYFNADIDDSHIPHQVKLTQAIFDAFE